MALHPPRPDRLPRPARLGLFALATAVLLFLCLAPTRVLPSSDLFWDKAEHAIAWLVLTAVGLTLSPTRPRAIAAFGVALGASVEILQMTLGFGRDGDWRDLAADVIGVAVGLAIWALVRRAALRPARA